VSFSNCSSVNFDGPLPPSYSNPSTRRSMTVLVAPIKCDPPCSFKPESSGAWGGIGPPCLCVGKP
jgi:hypothetical protein